MHDSTAEPHALIHRPGSSLPAQLQHVDVDPDVPRRVANAQQRQPRFRDSALSRRACRRHGRRWRPRIRHRRSRRGDPRVTDGGADVGRHRRRRRGSRHVIGGGGSSSPHRRRRRCAIDDRHARYCSGNSGRRPGRRADVEEPDHGHARHARDAFPARDVVNERRARESLATTARRARALEHLAR